MDVVNASFALPFMQRLHHSVDILLFNPPYVPTSDDEAERGQQSQPLTLAPSFSTKGPIAGAWAGGEDGMQVTNIFLDHVEALLSPRGRFYLVAVARNNIPRIREEMQSHYELESKIVLQRRAGREHLSVIRFMRREVV